MNIDLYALILDGIWGHGFTIVMGMFLYCALGPQNKRHQHSQLDVYTGGSHLSQIFWEHENLSSLSVILLISTNLH